MLFFRLKDRISWFTPSNYIVSDLYDGYNALDVLHGIKQPSACSTSLIMFLVVFSRQKSHMVSVAVFVIIQCLRLLVGFKPCKCIY